MFALNENVVYPGHGVACINRIIDKRVSGNIIRFYELKFLNNEMTVLVPMNSFETVGLRPLSSSQNISEILEMLSQSADYHEITAGNWNKRNKEYQCKIRTGNLHDICEIYRDLQVLSTHKELSFGEKSLLLQAEMLLAEEISIVTSVTEDKAIERLRLLFKGFKTARVSIKSSTESEFALQ
ncbi:MAG TPA: CarD family transcriptional regulator [Candidatus Babeliales bacterium]|nr:CarD family transcriptional regulator [Candidatus Babeliales bacterium]